MEEKKVPALRFRGFDNAWEQRHLGEIVERVTRKNENLESTLPLTISAQYGLIDQNEFFDKRIASKDISGYFLIRRGEFAYNKSTSTDAPWGAIKCLERYENGVLSTLYIVFRIIDEKKLNSNYLAFYYDTDLWHRGVQAIAAEGARNHGLLNIAPVDFFETTLAIPQDIFEQQKIGLFFKQLDHLISLHQRKLEMLKKVKKSMLEKMFPKNDAKVPEVRFSDFTDAWEQRKLGEVVKEVTRNDSASEAPIMMITANHGFIEQSERYAFNNAGESLKRYILLEKGELAYNHGASKLRPYGSCFALTTAENARIPFVYHCFSAEEQNAEFISIELNGSDVENQLRKIVSSGARMDGLLNISFAEYTSVSVLLPKIEEQNRIADFFRNLDRLISLHQRKLEKLKNIKKSMLEKMFI